MDVHRGDPQTEELGVFDASDATASANDRAVLADALVELLAASDTRPTPREMAERSGLPLTTVFTLLDDLESLAVAIFRTQIDRVWTQIDPLPGREASLEARVDALVAQRAHLFEQIAPTRRVAGEVLVNSSAVRKGLARSEAFLRRQTTETFEWELAAIDDPDLLAAIEFVTSYEAWEGMRRHDRRSASAAAQMLRVTLLSLLTRR
jgi:TetR/AcrR family transcriptional regulator, regulator of autoinduction and epiphytic fitness